MESTRSTSPPKSACPGVSMMLIFTPFHTIAAFLENMVIPRSRSKSFESMMRSVCATPAFIFVCDCFKSASTKVVLP